MKVSIIGSGYVGLSTAIALSYIGHDVSCIDIDQNKIDNLNEGIAPFYEPALDELLLKLKDKCEFTTDYKKGLADTEIVFLAVGTPSTPAGNANLTYLYDAITKIANHSFTNNPIIVTKSTVPVGTSKEIEAIFERVLPNQKFRIASNPEFLRQGRALHDTLFPERIVAGSSSKEALDIIKELYKPILEQSFADSKALARPKELTSVPFIATSIESAELAKYAANAFLATKISFANEIANVCDVVGADIKEVVEVLSHDSRIGSKFLNAGLGYGGSCFPKDTRALAYISHRGGYNFKLLNAVIGVSNDQRFKVIEKIENALGHLHGKNICILGLTFKPGTDDLRDAPSIDIAQELLQRGVNVSAHDPIAIETASKVLDPKVKLFSNVEAALKNADAVVLVTEWQDYIDLDWTDMKTVVKHAILIDGRNALNPKEMDEAGWIYQGVGRRGTIDKAVLI